MGNRLSYYQIVVRGGNMHKIRKQHERRSHYIKIRDYGLDILRAEGFQNSQNSIQHGDVSVREHCIFVASCALSISRMLPIRFRERELVRGALLHDYFLYDWHDKKVGLREILRFHEMHGFSHPQIALENAKAEFTLSKREEDIIKKHMWPLTITPPACREAWVVTVADKYCSLLETLRIYRSKTKSGCKAS